MTDERFDLYAARMNAGMSQRELAMACGVSLPTIQNLESGGSAQPRNVKKVADFFGVKVLDIVPPQPERAA